MRKNKLFVFMAIVVAALVLDSCSTKRNTVTRRMFHNLTSHYNVYWNGQYSLEEGNRNLKNTVQDDYSHVLRVYNYGTKSEAMGLNAQMDRALQKTSVCVQKHSMKFNGKERVKWIDDAYLVMGKAHFFKQDYIPARRTFEFVCTEFSYSDITLVANLWLIKTYIQTAQYPKAIATIEQLQNKISDRKNLPKEVLRNFNLTVADYYIATKDYAKAINYLKTGMLETNDRDLRLRAMFILGQIYMEMGDAKRATEWFKKVIRKNPKYEMLFEAKMNMAKMGSSGNAKELYKMLNRMLKDTKNEEFTDRIYFAMGDLAMREGDVTKAIGYYRESVAAASSNQIQRANSSLKVATILFDRNDYELSQAYYDTAVMSLNRDIPGYDSISNISQTLNELVLNLSVIRDQDSLLMVANMDSISRNVLIDKIIAQVVEEERLEKERQAYEEQLAMMGSTVGSSTVPDDGTTSGNWYFYNPTTLRNGYSEFSKKWGMRKLEDNWRISDKRNIGSGISDGDYSSVAGDDEGASRDSTMANLTNHDRAFYLQNLPFTAEQQEESHHMISEAMYNVGFIYFNRLADYPRSIEAYEGLDTRYPGNENELPSWYALYKMNSDLKDTEKAELYKSRILSKYPESSYANFILDPNYYQKIKEETQQASALYTKTYEAFQQGQYYRVRMNAERGLELYAADTAFAPRFALLDAISRGRLETVDTMAYALLNVVKTYPNSSIRNYAMTLVENINEEYHLGIDLGGLESGKGEVIPEKPASPYVYEPLSKHLVIIVFSPKDVKVEPLKVRISDFNKKNHRLKSFDMKNLLIGDEMMIVSLSEYDNEQEAKDYITSMYLTDYIFGGMDKAKYSVLPISVANYATFIKEKNLDGYKTFLNENSK